MLGAVGVCACNDFSTEGFVSHGRVRHERFMAVNSFPASGLRGRACLCIRVRHGRPLVFNHLGIANAICLMPDPSAWVLGREPGRRELCALSSALTRTSSSQVSLRGNSTTIARTVIPESSAPSTCENGDALRTPIPRRYFRRKSSRRVRSVSGLLIRTLWIVELPGIHASSAVVAGNPRSRFEHCANLELRRPIAVIRPVCVSLRNH
jgi:hypothetical protein